MLKTDAYPIRDKYITITYLLSVYSYPITAILILFLGLPPSNTNLFIKVSYLLFYLYVCLLCLDNFKIQVPKLIFPLLLFFLIYSIRLVYDVSFRQIPFASGSSFYVYSYYFGVTIIPCLAIIFSRSNINPEKCLVSLFYTLIVSNCLIIVYLIIAGAQNYMDLFAIRANVTSDENIGTDSVFLSPIWISQTGGALCLLAFLNMLFIKGSSIFRKSINFFAIVLGVSNLLIGASRGPLFSLILILVISGFYYLYWHPKNIKLIRKITLFIIGFIIVLMTIIIPFVLNNDIALFQRITIFSNDWVSSEQEVRNIIFQESFNAFLDSPFFGESYVLKSNNGYPHNIVLEVLMSTGIIGFLLFFVALMNLLKRSYHVIFKSNNVNNFMMFSLALLPFLLGMTSGSIFVNPEVWVSLCVILVLPKK